MKSSEQIKADMMLVVITIFWGMSYVFMDMCLEHLTPFMLNTYRFLIAFGIVFVCFIKRTVKVNKVTLKFAFFGSLTLMAVYVCTTYGVMGTTASNAGFLCSLTSIFTPIVAFLWRGQRQEKKLVAAVIVCLLGIMLLTLNEDFGINREHILGDILCVGCALFYAFNLLTLEKGVNTEGVDAFNLGVYQMGFVGVYNLIMVLVMGEAAFPPTKNIWLMVIFLAIFCTAVAYMLQPLAQRHTTASHVGIIYTLEPVFSAIAAALIAHEFLAPRNYLGALIMLMGIFIMELDWKSIFKGKE